MKALFTFLVFFWSCFSPYCQYNLVPNYSFEESVICPSQFNGDSLPRPWYIPSNYQDFYFYTSCSTDYSTGTPFNTAYDDTSFQYAKTGNSYATIETFFSFFFTDARSYIQVKLKDSLHAGKCYYCEFWVNLPNPLNRATNNLSMLLTKSAIYSDTIASPFGVLLIAANAQIVSYGNPIMTDTMNWVKVSGVYTARGGEQYITIGNFKNDANTKVKVVNTNGDDRVGYFVDDVSVIPLDSMLLKADAGRDTVIATGDSAFVGSLTNGLTNVKWYNSGGTVIKTGVPGFYVKPTTSTWYVIEQTVCGYNSRDTVVVSVGAMPVTLTSFTGERKETSNVLLWETATEVNSSGFELQRSADGINFSSIAFVDSKGAGGNSTSALKYSFIDKRLLQGTSYYRLKQVDKDGKYMLSQVVMIKGGGAAAMSLSVYPNPATKVVNVILHGTPAKGGLLSLYDVAGRLLLTRTITPSNPTTIDVSALGKGVYMLQVRDADGRLASGKIIVQ